MKTSKNILTRLHKYFPEVKYVKDSKKSVAVSVKKKDLIGARRKSAYSCALAKACLREQHVDGALINIGFSYLIRGNTATRYKTSVAVGREITSFDRHGDFACGKDYILGKIPRSMRIGRPRTEQSLKRGPHTTKKALPEVIKKHKTTRIRVSGAK